MADDIITEDMELEEQLELARTLPASKLLMSASGYNWDMYPAQTLFAIARRDDCSLLTALSIFYAGEPDYDEDHPESARHRAPITEMLRYIHDRVNAGGYSHDPKDLETPWWKDPYNLFLAPRTRDDGNPILWQLDPMIVLAALPTDQQKKAKRDAKVAMAAKRHNAELNSDDPFTSKFAEKFEELFPDMPGVAAARAEREAETPQKSSFLSRFLGRGRPN